MFCTSSSHVLRVSECVMLSLPRGTWIDVFFVRDVHTCWESVIPDMTWSNFIVSAFPIRSSRPRIYRCFHVSTFPSHTGTFSIVQDVLGESRFPCGSGEVISVFIESLFKVTFCPSYGKCIAVITSYFMYSSFWTLLWLSILLLIILFNLLFTSDLNVLACLFD